MTRKLTAATATKALILDVHRKDGRCDVNWSPVRDDLDPPPADPRAAHPLAAETAVTLA